MRHRDYGTFDKSTTVDGRATKIEDDEHGLLEVSGLSLTNIASSQVTANYCRSIHPYVIYPFEYFLQNKHSISTK